MASLVDSRDSDWVGIVKSDRPPGFPINILNIKLMLFGRQSLQFYAQLTKVPVDLR